MKQENKLLQYSTFAVSFLVMKEADSQAVYTDIDPDTVINLDGEHGYIDINNDDEFDFRFFKFTGTESTYWGDYFSYFYYIHVAPQTLQNAIAGVYAVIDPSYGGFTAYYPFAFSFGEAINDTLTFQNNDFQILAGRIEFEGLAVEDRGFWYPQNIDHYVGVRFLDKDSCTHYGWIRCDVKSGGDTLIIKDYAYELKCDVGILAGDTIGDTTTVAIEGLNSLNATVYSFNKSVFINLSEFTNRVEMYIYDLSGKMIYSDKLTNGFTQVKLNRTKGIYFIELMDEKNKLVKKIYIN